jgi:predicted RNA-binding Zn ribbon-like protein
MASRADQVIPAPAIDLCLAYANTRYWRGTAAPTEELKSPDELWHWVRSVAHVPPMLFDRSGLAGMFDNAIGLREAIYRCFAATARGRAPDDEDLAALNAALAEAPSRQRVRLGGWDLDVPDATVSVLLGPVLWSAADLLVGAQLRRVRQCVNPACGWLFLDDSKSGTRRWCSMSTCGNRAKARRHYQRQKGK